MELVDVLRSVFELLRKCEVEYMVGGSFASGAWGEPRHTNDIDITADIKNMDQARLLARVAEPDFHLAVKEMEAVVSRKQENEAFQLLHSEQLFKVDVFLLTDSPFAQSAFLRRTAVEILPGITAFCATAEDIILRKLLWYELGNRVSDKQWNDIVKIVEVQTGALDQDYLRSWGVQLDVAGLLDDAWSEARKVL